MQTEWPASEIVRRPVAALTPYARNARTHSAAQVQQIAASMIIAGHGRVMAAQKLGIAEVPCIVAKGWTKAQKQAYVIADNQLALQAGWNRELLKVEVGELASLDFELDKLGFDDLELKGLLQSDAELEEGYEKQVEVPTDPVSAIGDLWTLGEHRLLCGDSTDEGAVVRLLDGGKPRLMVTDPPYGVDYDATWRDEALKDCSAKRRTGRVQNDDRVDWAAAWKLFPGDVAYVWHAGVAAAEVAASMLQAAFEVRAQIIWRKPQIVVGRGAYHWQHEPCWYAVRKGKKAHWIGDRKQSTCWDIDHLLKRQRNAGTEDEWTNHSTQKPVECMGRPIRNHDAPEVYEPFAGSGSTLIACELLGRRCFAMELDPGYCDVIVKRWQDRTGKKAVDAAGEEFDARAARKVVNGSEA